MERLSITRLHLLNYLLSQSINRLVDLLIICWLICMKKRSAVEDWSASSAHALTWVVNDTAELSVAQFHRPRPNPTHTQPNPHTTKMQWCAKLQIFTKQNYCFPTQSYIQVVMYSVHHICFSQICHFRFRPMTQPNPLKTKIVDPLPT